jgi:hypothetical protein
MPDGGLSLLHHGPVTPRSTSRPQESFEQRVLAALAMGASAPEEIAAGLTESPERVRQALDWAVSAEVASRVDLPGGATYALTAKGREILGVMPEAMAAPAAPAAPIAPDDVAGGDPTAPPPPPSIDADLVSAIAPSGQVPVSTAPRKVQWRHVAYAAAYVLIGLFLLTLQPVVGGLAILAGLALGGWSLRPFLAANR